jgi:hypothetical protein
MTEFLTHLKLFPSKVMAAINGLIDGLKVQMSTAKGAIFLIIVVLLIADVLVDGKLNVLKFSIEQGTGLFKAIFDILKDVGVSVLAVVAVIYFIHTQKKP